MSGVESKGNIVVCNSRVNNLKNVTVSFPLSSFTCVTGVSGGGKSSLVYDTIYAESQRNFFESMSGNMYGLKLMDKPDVDEIINLRPALSVKQNYYNFNPRSTVGTISDISHYLRSVFALIANESFYLNLTPGYFSANTPESCCHACMGSGEEYYVSLSKVISDERKTLADGGIAYFSGKEGSYEKRLLEAICNYYSIDINKRVCDLSEYERDVLLYAKQKIELSFRFKNYKGVYRQAKVEFTGVINELEEKLTKINKASVFTEISSFLDKKPCSVCHGSRLIQDVLEIRILNKNIFQVEKLSLDDLLVWINEVTDYYRDAVFAKQLGQLTAIIKRRTQTQIDLKLGYLCLARSVPSLSGGELQRIRIATQLNCSLNGLVYILDEPCNGLHHRDIDRIIRATRQLVEKGNTVIAIEHNKQYISHADKIIELGPVGGNFGGYVINDDVSVASVESNLQFKTPNTPKKYIQFNDICFRNILHQDISLPLGVTTCITGVSGSGKSSFIKVIFDCIAENRAIHCNSLRGDVPMKTLLVDQKPIGKTSRSTIVSYLGIYDDIRNCFAFVSEAKKAKLTASSFSVNVEGGRCESCQGTGVKKIELKYLPDSYIKCPTCHGNRFIPEVLQIRFKGKNINDVLSEPVEQIINLFENNEVIYNKLKCMIDLGIGYLSMGQLSMNLSGGEAQRIKLAKVLGTPNKDRCVYILDEPTSGLNSKDIDRITSVINYLNKQGETVVIVEHNIEFISRLADCIIDFGCKPGDAGGVPKLFEFPKSAFETAGSSLYGLM